MPANHTTREGITDTNQTVMDDLLNQLRQLIPSVFLGGKLDWHELRLLLGDAVNDQPERYRFTWSGKTDAIKAYRAPTWSTLSPDSAQSVDFDTTQNVFIEGDNLEVLKLLYKPYFGRVKMIYIDPPYNTGNDFIYPDDFAQPKDTYLKLTGQIDGNGNQLTTNPEASGRYHSAWLTMMYPRLLLARQLLRDDGVIFISIDDHEVYNLRLLLNEIFGEENFLATVVWQKKYGPANDAKQFSPTHEYVHVYARQAAQWRPELLARTDEQLAAFKNPDQDPRGPWRASDLSARTASASCIYPITLPSGRTVNPPASRSWIVSSKRFEQLIADNRIWFGVDGDGRPMQKRFLSEVKQGITPQTWWDRDFAGDNKVARYELKDLIPQNFFDTPKPVALIKRMVEMATEPDQGDIVLDFFAGSCTTADAVLTQNREDGGNRRFIMVQLPEPTGDEHLPTIADVGKERIRSSLQRSKSHGPTQLPLDDRHGGDEGLRVFIQRTSNLRPPPQGYPTPQAYTAQLELLSDRLLEGWKPMAVIWEFALGEGYPLDARISEFDPGGPATIFRIADPNSDTSFLICLDDTLSPETVAELRLTRDVTFVCRDTALTDSLAANLSLQCRLKTI